MTQRTTTTIINVDGSTFDGLDSPVFPGKLTSTGTAIANVTGFDEYIGTANGANPGASGSINFLSGASVVMGKPRLDDTINANSATTMTNQNAPYIYSAATPEWDLESAYNVGDLVNFEGTAYTCTTAVSASSATTSSMSIGFDNTVGTNVVNTGQQGITFQGFDAGDISLTTVQSSTSVSTYTEFRIQNDSTVGFNPNSQDLVTIFGTDRNDLVSILTWIARQIALINDPSTATFNTQISTWLRFTAAQSTSGDVTTMTLTPKSGVSWPGGITVKAFDFPPYIAGSFAKTISGGNSDPTTATGSWDQTGTLLPNRWATNANSIVPLNADGFIDIVEPGATLRLTGNYDGVDTGGQNFTMFRSTNTDCAPVFYGTTFVIDGNSGGTGNMNLIGDTDGSFNAADGESTVQFHDCKFFVSSTTSNFRFAGDKYLLNGFDFRTTGAGIGFEFLKPPLFPPRGLVLQTPRQSSLTPRIALVFCEGGGSGSTIDFCYLFEGLSAPNFTTYNAFSAGNPKNGVVTINPADAPPIPFSTSATTTASSLTRPILLGTKGTETTDSGFGAALSTNAQLLMQRVRLTFPGNGWTVRVAKTATRVYSQLPAQSQTVLWQNASRTSNGGFVRDTTATGDSANSTVRYFPFSGDPVTTSNGSLRDLTVVETLYNNNRFESTDNVVYYGFDGVAAGTTIDLLLPAIINQSKVGTATDHDDVYYTFSYQIISQNADFNNIDGSRDGAVSNLSYDPNSSNWVESFGVGGNEEIIVRGNLDPLYNDPGDLDTLEIVDLDSLYGTLKKYNILRNGNTPYGGSGHSMTQDSIFTITDNTIVFDTDGLSMTRAFTGRAVQLSGTDLKLKFGTWDANNTETTITGITFPGAATVSLAAFTSLTNFTLTAQNFVDLTASANSTDFVVGENMALVGSYVESTALNARRSYAFPQSADVSELTLTFNSSLPITIFGKVAVDFKSISNTGTGGLVFEKTTVFTITLPSTNRIGAERFTFNGTPVTVGTPTVANGNTVWTYTSDSPGTLVAGVYVDGFLFSYVSVASSSDPLVTTASAQFSLVGITLDSINFNVVLGSVATAVVNPLNFTAAFASDTGVYTVTLKTTPIEATLGTQHTAIPRLQAQLVTRRLLETTAGIDWVLAQPVADRDTFNLYDSEGWIIQKPSKLKIEWDDAETKDLQINHYPRQLENGAAVWNVIINDEPSLSPGFPSEGPNVTPVTEDVADTIGDITVERTKEAFKKTSRLIPVNDSDFPSS